MIIKTLRVATWAVSNKLLGGIFPGVAISRARVGNLRLKLRADGYVVITDECKGVDVLPITCVSVDVALKLINAQRWPWQQPVTKEEAAQKGVDV